MLDGMASARMATRQAGAAMTARMAGAALLDLMRAGLGLSPHYVPLAAPPGELAAMVAPDAYMGCLSIMPPGWRNEVAARFLLALPFYRPSRHAAEVTCPTLIIACANDTVASTKAAAETAARIGDKARLVTLPIGHFDIYLGVWLERSCGEQLDFFQTTLKRARAVVKA